MGYYTDIALESVDKTFQKRESALDYGFNEAIINIDTLKKERLYGKPKGEYYLLDCPNLNLLAPVAYEYATMQVASYLQYKIKDLTKKDEYKVLVVCLGNENVVCDSLGSGVFDKLITTIDNSDKAYSLKAVKTNVLAQTGIDSATHTKSIVELVKPDVVILVDSLCSKSIYRIGTSIQITDSGIIAGGAVGLSDRVIDSSFLKCPTIAIGIPYVVRVNTLVGEVLESLSDDESDTKTINGKFGNLIVTPNDIDALIKLGSNIISGAINMAVLGLDLNEQKMVKI